MSYDQETSVILKVTGWVLSDTPDFADRDAHNVVLGDVLDAITPVLAEEGYTVVEYAASDAPFDQWQAAVANRNTTLGYVDWARNQA